jgi:hypothetical protein
MLHRVPLDRESLVCERMLKIQTGIGARYRFPKMDGGCVVVSRLQSKTADVVSNRV